MDGWMDRQIMDGRMDGQIMDGWTDNGWMVDKKKDDNGQMNKLRHGASGKMRQKLSPSADIQDTNGTVEESEVDPVLTRRFVSEERQTDTNQES